VAAICATTAGWYLMNGHVTPVASSIVEVRAAIAASIEKAKPECSCSLTHGWKWSLTSTKSKPAASARTACSTISSGP
jgi:hypothetical protein